jgi:hypothetical protein
MDAESQAAFVEALVKGVSYLSVWAGDRQVPDDRRRGSDADDRRLRPRLELPAARRRAEGLDGRLDRDDPRERLPARTASTSSSASPTPRRQPAARRPSEQPAWTRDPDSVRREPARRRADRPAPQPAAAALRGRVRARRRLPDPEPDQRVPLPARARRLLRRAQAALGRRPLDHGRRERQGRSSRSTSTSASSGSRPRRGRPEVKFGEFSQTELDGYIKAIEQKVLHIAVTTRTPRHYLFQEGQSPSGDAIKSAESGLVKKVERKQRRSVKASRRRSRSRAVRRREGRAGRLRDRLGRPADRDEARSPTP